MFLPGRFKPVYKLKIGRACPVLWEVPLLLEGEGGVKLEEDYIIISPVQRFRSTSMSVIGRISWMQ